MIAGALAGVALLVVCDRLVFESIYVPTGSMEPTILPNERLFVWKWPAWRLNRFDVVVVKLAGRPHRVIKRVVALPGECVTLQDGFRVEIDGKPLSLTDDDSHRGIFREHGFDSERDHAIQAAIDSRQPDREAASGRRQTTCLNADEYYVLGDNRWRSRDGRAFGPVRREDIDGAAWLVWMSVDRCLQRMRWERVGAAV